MERILILLALLVVGCGGSVGDSNGVNSASTSAGAPSTQALEFNTSPNFRGQGVPLSYHITGDWGSGFGAELVLTNLGNSPLTNWALEFDAAFQIDSLWNARLSSGPGGFRLAPETWNTTIPPGGSVTIGFNGRPGGAVATPTNFRLNGTSIPVNADSGNTESTPTPTPTPTPTSTPSPTPAPQTGAVEVTPTITGDWGSGFGANVVIRNNGMHPASGWTLQFDLVGAQTPKIDSIWNVKILSVQGKTVKVGPVAWNAILAPNTQIEFGFNGSPGGVSFQNLIFTSDGTGGSTPGPSPSPTPTSTPSPTPTPTPTPTPSSTPTPTPPPTSSGSGPGLVAYFAEWGIYDRNYLVSDIPADSVNVINYAFAKIDEQGKVALFDAWAAVDKAFPGDTWDQPLKGNFHQLKLLKAQHPHLKVMISVGGWTLSGRFSDIALTTASREKFARSAVDFVVLYGLDGVDIDWEYPVTGGLGSNVTRPEDGHNYTLLLKELRRQLDQRAVADGRPYLLSIAAPAGSDKYQYLELSEIAKTLDWINVMTYDFHGGWERVTNHHAPLFRNPNDPTPASLGYTVSDSIQGYLDAGVPPHKVVLGVPAYGLSWIGSQGLFASATGVGQGTWDNTGVFDYKDLVNRRAQQPSVYQRLWDSVAKAPVLLAPSMQGLVVSYEDEQSLAAKVAYAKEKKLGGFLLWELSGDVADVNRPDSLVGVMARALKTWN